jgi:protein-export membrane protein SecD
MLYFSPWKTAIVIGFCLLGLVFAMPNVIPKDTLESWPGWLPKKQINLGLDLQGGAHLLLEVQYNDVVRERIVAMEDEIRIALRGARIAFSGLTTDETGVRVQIREAADVDRARALIRERTAPVQTTVIGLAGQQDFNIRVDGNTIRAEISDAAREQIRTQTVDQSIEIVRRRIDEMGTLEPTIQRQGFERIIVQVPGEGDPQRILDLLGQTASMEFRMHDNSVPIEEALAGRVPPGSEVFPTEDPYEPYILLYRRVLLTGDRLIDAQQTFDQRDGQPVVTFRFDSAGARQFGNVTRQNVNRRFAILLDGRVISAPVIREPILGGSGQISGNFTVQSANDLAILLRAGALPAALTPLEQRTVGPDLGADSIEAGQMAAVIGFVAVIVFIFLAYGFFGIFANIALIMNLILIAGALSLLQATLTLPGIAGIVLTIGMAVDANVLIFERIKEEVRTGKSPINAIQSGYNQAKSTIFDANITTLIAAVILFQMGSGPVRGFAVTLGIGIVTSVFTAFVLNRLMISTWLRQARPSAVPL